MSGGVLPERNYRVERVAAPLRQSVTESIRYAIAAQRFQAGERLPERELCEMTGVSRTLIREALRQLESEGLIEVLPHRGPIVARLTAAQARGVYQVRALLEGLACELFAANASDGQLAALQAAFEALRGAYQSDEPMARLSAKNRFYDALIQGSGNEALGQSLRMLNTRIMLLRTMSLKAPGRGRESLIELGALMKALVRRDPEGARRAAVHHVERAAASALKMLDEDG